MRTLGIFVLTCFGSALLATSVRCGPTDFHGNDTLDMSAQDANMLCYTDADHDYCGSINPLGCSCQAKCEFLGTCCSDYRSACVVTRPQGSFSSTAVAGRETWKVTIPQKAGARIHHMMTGNDGFNHTFVAPASAGHNGVAAALTGVSISDLDNRDDEAVCLVNQKTNNGVSTADGNFYSVGAQAINFTGTQYGSIGVECRAAALVPPAEGITWEDRVIITPEETRSANGVSVINNGYTFGTSRTHTQAYSEGVAEAVLTRFKIRGTNSGRSSARCWAHWSEFEQQFVVQNHSVRNAECGARVIDGNGSGLRYVGEFSSGGMGSTVTMYPQATHACFLAEVDFVGYNNWELQDVLGVLDIPLFFYEQNTRSCAISYEDNMWVLNATGLSTRCMAKCFVMEGAGPTWPPQPIDTLESSYQGPMSAAKEIQDVATTGYLYTYGTGDTAYDNPAVVVEGADAGNMVDTNYYVRLTPDLFHDLLEQGFDIWLLDFTSSGQLTMLDNAQATADLLQKVADRSAQHGFFGLKFPTLGGSQGAQRLRAALASWEDGRYRESGGMWPVEGIRTRSPPVSLMLSANGSVDGTHLPTSVLAAVYDMGRMNPELGKSEVFEMVMSENTKEVLTENLAVDSISLTPAVGGDACYDKNGRDGMGRLWDVCNIDIGPLHLKSINILRYAHDMPLNADGLVSADLCGTPRYQSYYTWSPWSTNCACFDQACSDCDWMDFVYDTINGNGWPQQPLKVGISQGSWFAQRCDRYPDWVMDKYLDCRADASGAQAFVGTLDFKASPFPGHLIVDTSACHRTAYLKFENARLRRDGLPGDFTSAFNLGLLEQHVGLPGFVERMDFKQYHPFMFNETSRSLGCPPRGTNQWGVKTYGELHTFTLDQQAGNVPVIRSDEWCRAQNEAEGWFDFVHSQHMTNSLGMVYNASHDEFEYENGLLVKMYAWDCRADGGDCDGFFGDGSGNHGEEEPNPIWIEAKAYVDNPTTNASPEFSAIVNDRRDCFDTIFQEVVDCAPRVLTFGHDGSHWEFQAIGETFKPNYGCLAGPCPDKYFADIYVTLQYDVLDQEIRIPIIYDAAASSARMGLPGDDSDGHMDTTHATATTQGFELTLFANHMTSYPAAIVVHDDWFVDTEREEFFVFRIGDNITLADGSPAPYNFIIDERPFLVRIVDNDRYLANITSASVSQITGTYATIEWTGSTAFIATDDQMQIECLYPSNCYPQKFTVPDGLESKSISAAFTPCVLQSFRLRGVDNDISEGSAPVTSEDFFDVHAMYSDGSCALAPPSAVQLENNGRMGAGDEIGVTVSWAQYISEPGLYDTDTYIPSADEGETLIKVFLDDKPGLPLVNLWTSTPATEQGSGHRVSRSGSANIVNCTSKVWKFVVTNSSGMRLNSQVVELPFTRDDYGDCAANTPAAFSLAGNRDTITAHWTSDPSLRSVNGYFCPDKPGCMEPTYLWTAIEDPEQPGQSLPFLIPEALRCARFYVRLTGINHEGFASPATSEQSYWDPICSRPDLVVKHKVDPQKSTTLDTIMVDVVVTNIGNSTAIPSSVAVDVGRGLYRETVSVPSLKPGKSFAIRRELSINQTGYYRVVFTADSRMQIPEIDETNNYSSSGITISVPLRRRSLRYP